MPRTEKLLRPKKCRRCDAGLQWKAEGGCGEHGLFHEPQVAPKVGALECNACQSPTGVMDFKKLDYSDKQVKSLTTNW